MDALFWALIVKSGTVYKWIDGRAKKAGEQADTGLVDVM